MSAARVIPPHDPKAKLPYLAYSIKDMFPEQLLKSLNNGQLLYAVEKPEDKQALIQKQKVPAYIIQRLQLLADIPKSKEIERKRKARILALLAALIQLATARPRLRLQPPRPATVSSIGVYGSNCRVVNCLL